MKNDLTDVNLMFKAIVESESHEGGLLAPFTGSSPALGSIIVRVDDGTYIGKIDAVLGNTDAPIAHIAHLDRKINSKSFLGCEAQIRAKTKKQDDNTRPQSNRYENREKRENQRGRDNYNHTDSRRGNFRDRNSDRRDSRRGNFRDRNSDRRDSRRGYFRDRNSDRRDSRRGDFRDRNSDRRDSRRGNFRDRNTGNNKTQGRDNKIFADNDWTCRKCNNVNFSFRKECNRCGEPKHGNSDGERNVVRHDNRPRNDRANRHVSGPRKFRKAKGKSANHAHNRGPKPLDVRSRRRNRDD